MHSTVFEPSINTPSNIFAWVLNLQSVKEEESSQRIKPNLFPLDKEAQFK
jgi:hypothetical protein